MNIKIAINTDNAAFEDSSLQWELSRILETLAKRIANFQDLQFESGNEIRILDHNGNVCGKLEITD